MEKSMRRYPEPMKPGVTQADKDAALKAYPILPAEAADRMVNQARFSLRSGYAQALADTRPPASDTAGDALREAAQLVFDAWDKHCAATERTNAARPNIGTATRAEYAVYDERYRDSEEAARDWFAAAHAFVKNPSARAALSQPSPDEGAGAQGTVRSADVGQEELVTRLRRNAEWRDDRHQCVTDPNLLKEAAEALATRPDAAPIASVVVQLSAIRTVLREAHWALDDSEDLSHQDPPVHAVPLDNVMRLHRALKACERFAPESEAWDGPGPLATQIIEWLGTSPALTASPDDSLGRLRDAATRLLPTNVSLDNPAWPDSTILPVGVTLGDLRALREALALSTNSKGSRGGQ